MLCVRVIIGCEGLGVKAEAEMNGMEVQSMNDWENKLGPLIDTENEEEMLGGDYQFKFGQMGCQDIQLKFSGAILCTHTHTHTIMGHFAMYENILVDTTGGSECYWYLLGTHPTMHKPLTITKNDLVQNVIRAEFGKVWGRWFRRKIEMILKKL